MPFSFVRRTVAFASERRRFYFPPMLDDGQRHLFAGPGASWRLRIPALMLAALLLSITSVSAKKASDPLLELLVQARGGQLAARADSLIDSDARIGVLSRRIADLNKWQRKQKRPWDQLRWSGRVRCVAGRVWYRLATLQLAAGDRLSAEAAAARSVELDGSPEAYRLLAEILHQEGFAEEALGTLLSGWGLTGRGDLLPDAKQLYVSQGFPEETWDDYRRQYQESSLEMLLREARKRAASGEQLTIPRSCRPKLERGEAVGVVVVWDECGGEEEATVLRELQLRMNSAGVPYAFCFAGLHSDSGQAAAESWGLDLSVKKVRIRGKRLLRAGVESLPAVVLLREGSPPLLFTGERRLLPDLVDRALRTERQGGR